MRLELREVSRSFPGVAAVDRLSLTVEAGRIGCLLGPSGSGKSTTLRCIAGFERPEVGTVLAGGECLSSPDIWVPPEATAHRHGVPGLRAVSAPRCPRQRRLRTARPRARRPPAPCAGAARARRPRRRSRPLPPRTVRRPAATRRARAGTRAAAAARAARRALLQPRCRRAHGSRAGGARGPAGRRRDGAARHARPARGVRDRRRDRRPARRPARAMGCALEALPFSEDAIRR